MIFSTSLVKLIKIIHHFVYIFFLLNNFKFLIFPFGFSVCTFYQNKFKSLQLCTCLHYFKLRKYLKFLEVFFFFISSSAHTHSHVICLQTWSMIRLIQSIQIIQLLQLLLSFQSLWNKLYRDEVVHTLDIVITTGPIELRKVFLKNCFDAPNRHPK